MVNKAHSLVVEAHAIVHAMPKRLCPYCKSIADMKPVWSGSELLTENGYARTYVGRAACTCSNCENVNSVIEKKTSTNWASLNMAEVRTAIDKGVNLVWSPLSAAAPDYPRVPAHVARCAQEAHMSHSIGAEAASILMARSTIEATAKSKDITTGNLYEKIEKLSTSGIIRPAALSLAHAIRHLGNDMAHGDVENGATAEDASDVLELMDLILNEVFQATSLAEEIIARRKRA